MTEAQADELLARLRPLLTAAKQVEIEVGASTLERDNWRTGYVQYDPLDGKTITIRLDGGAREEHGEPIR